MVITPWLRRWQTAASRFAVRRRSVRQLGQLSQVHAVERLEDRTLLAVMTDGPLVGAVTHESAKVFARTDSVAFVAVEYSTDPSFGSSVVTPAELTSAGSDYTTIITLTGLQEQTKYYYRILVDGQAQATASAASFVSFPLPGAADDFQFAVVADLNDLTRVEPFPTAPAPVYEHVAAESPVFVLQVGDLDHRDPQVLDDFRQMHREVRGPLTPAGADFAEHIASQFPLYHVWDDHDYGINDGNKNFPGRADALQAFQEYFPTPDLPNPDAGIWHSFGYGLAEFFMLDLRSQRDPNSDPDGPDKSILDGDEISDGQKEWLKQQLLDSTAEWKFVITSVTMNATARPTSKDTWRNFATERDEILQFIEDNGIDNVVLISGDIHTGGGIDNGTNSFLPEINIAHTNRRKANVGNLGEWSDGIAPGLEPGGPGYSVVHITHGGQRVLVESKGEHGELRTVSMLAPAGITSSAAHSLFDAATGQLSIVALEAVDLSVSASGGLLQVTVDGQVDASVANVSAAEVRTIFIQGSAESDTIDLSAVSAAAGFTNLSGVTVQGSSGDDSIVGTETTGGGATNDFLLGGSGNDTILGGTGDDTLRGGNGNDLLNAGAGDDSLTGDAGDDVLVGGNGSDELLSYGGSDQLRGGNGRDSITVQFIQLTPDAPPLISVDGGGGNDDLLVTATSHKDTITVGDDGMGRPVVQFETRQVIAAGVELLAVDGKNGQDVINASASPVGVHLIGGDGQDTLVGGSHDDTLSGNGDDDSLRGGDGHDVLDGGDGADVLKGQRGNDMISGGEGRDTLYGGGHRDRLIGGPGEDALNGNAGNDTLDGDSGDDTLAGNGGDDILSGGPQHDLLKGGDGKDTLRGNAGNDTLRGDAGDDSLHAANGHDSLVGHDGQDSLHGGNGDDTLKGGAGNDGLAGWNGDDNLAGWGGDDTLLGGDGKDTLLGGNGDDIALGEQGFDRVKGQGNNDTVAGGGNGIAAEAQDTVLGETVDDQFMFDAPWVWV